jgi:glycosyltransferase involved in cell wall biosynthesis
VTFHGGGHSSWLRRRLRRTQWALLRPLLARANRLVAIARFEIDLYGAALNIPRERFALIPTGIDVTTNDPVSPSENRGAAVIASVGRLERYKGHHRLIEALPEILHSQPDVRVWIAGTGPYEDALKRMARRRGVADRVEIRAVPAHDERAMTAELSRVALVVLLSDRETLPIAVLEALAARRPVLVTYAQGLDELADRGLVCAISLESSPREIAAAVLQQLHDPFVPAHVDLPTWDDCADRHLEMYASLMQEARRNKG